MTQRKKLVFIILLLVSLASLFMFYKMGHNLDYVIPRRALRLAAMLIVGVSVAYSSIVFQTITNNKILTPAIMGYESVFILFQTVIVFIYGDKTFQVVNDQENFLYAVLLMMVFSFIMYVLMFGRGKQNIYHLLLLGLVLGTLFTTFGRFLQIVIDPNEFSVVQSFMFVSFNKMNTNLLLFASLTLVGTLLFAQRYLKYLDVIALGREHAVNLGLDYTKLVKIFMLIISLLVSVSTALVGPVTFLGILVANLTYELFKTRKHNHMVWICSVLACVSLILGQFLVEHIFNFSTTVSIVINFVGGLYFMYLILKSRKTI